MTPPSYSMEGGRDTTTRFSPHAVYLLQSSLFPSLHGKQTRQIPAPRMQAQDIPIGIPVIMHFLEHLEPSGN